MIMARLTKNLPGHGNNTGILPKGDPMNAPQQLDTMTKITSLCKRRGFIFQSSEIYGGLRSAYDYGPLGAELKRNLANEWWRAMVHEREDIVGMDASIMMHPKIWETSGHVAGFNDPLVDCLNCRERFRADKAPKKDMGTEVVYHKGGKQAGEKIKGKVDRGYVCPQCGAPTLSAERQFNMMFRTFYGPLDPFSDFIEAAAEKNLSKQELRAELDKAVQPATVYLRPETAGAIFAQYLNVQQSMSMKPPFGIAQIGSAFRNEIVTEHLTFRSCEFTQMELEWFCEPGTEGEWYNYWKDQRIKWWQTFANDKTAFKHLEYPKEDLAHYATACTDILYKFPWGWDELEGIASRTDFDLGRHAAATGVKLSYFDQQKADPATGKMGWRYTPYVIEPSAGLTRGMLALLCDAYTEDKGVDYEGKEKTRVFLRLHPKLAPFKAAILPLVKKDGQPEKAQKIAAALRREGLFVSCDESQSIGKRYAKHDEIGTPFCLTVDPQTLEDDTVTVRDRDTAEQQRVPIKEAVRMIVERVKGPAIID
jgi:glycyl-tRNA synthetase